ncbi:hypothetical protein B0H10DRAFT_1956872 [Mycena sp. CBHHK59/15]|nr:hypothetical protein B0H10DRAFT_1956872 [Mycena sp. CBHHK59/15]
MHLAAAFAIAVWTPPRSRRSPRLDAAAYHTIPFPPRHARTRRPHSLAADSSERAPGCTPFVSLFPAHPRARAPANSTCLTRSKRLRDRARAPLSFLGAANPVCAGTSWRENENTAMGTLRRGMGTMHRRTTATPSRSDIYVADETGVAHLKFAVRTSRGGGWGEGNVGRSTVAHALVWSHVPSAVPSVPRAHLPALPQHIPLFPPSTFALAMPYSTVRPSLFADTLPAPYPPPYVLFRQIRYDDVLLNYRVLCISSPMNEFWQSLVKSARK